MSEKREPHTAQLLVALLAQLLPLGLLDIEGYRGGRPSLSLLILIDILVGLSLLPIIAAFRRGTYAHKSAAYWLSIVPFFYIWLVGGHNLSLVLNEWKNQ